MLQTGCNTGSAAPEAFFCDYVLAVLRTDPAYKSVYKELNTTGGLRIYTTLNKQDQAAAQNAVDFVEPARSAIYNPQRNADTEVLISPAPGQIRAIAVNRQYGSGPGEDNIDYAVDGPYDGGVGVQTGSSSKIFTLITALKQGIPFGYNQSIVSPTTVGPYHGLRRRVRRRLPRP